MGKHLEQALPSVYTLQCLTGKVDNNNNNNNCSQLWRPFLIKHINLLESIQRQATKWILNDYHVSYRSCLMSLQLLPLMYVYNINDIIFFIDPYQPPSTYFNIAEHVQFITSNTRFGSSQTMIHHRCLSNTTQKFYFHHLPRLWNSLPRIDLTLPICTIKHKLYNYKWEHFIGNFDDTNEHSLQYNCPFCHCDTALMTPLHRELT